MKDYEQSRSRFMQSFYIGFVCFVLILGPYYQVSICMTIGPLGSLCDKNVFSCNLLVNGTIL